jgi:hypothetical protein
MTSETPIVVQAARCAARVVSLLLERRLHLHGGRVGDVVALPDGRQFEVFRESSCDTAATTPVLLAVWFRLRAIPPGARVRRWLFERACLVNTLLFAGCEGFLVKLWMVDPQTSDYAGLYSWRSAAEAAHYARYITGILRPWCGRGSVGFEVFERATLDGYLDGRANNRVLASVSRLDRGV